ncbi:MAG: hypothetical protein GY701_28850 [Sulfitobacter sp.]|nr:hypothetical protein [Sulfitobacter sp.]
MPSESGYRAAHHEPHHWALRPRQTQHRKVVTPPRDRGVLTRAALALGFWKALGFVLLCWAMFSAVVLGFTL